MPGPPDPEAALAASRAAQARGDEAAALHQVGWALTADPMRADALAQLGAILQPILARPDPLAAVPKRPDEPFVDAANRAYLLAWMQRWAEALDLITDVAEVRPDVPYLKWAEWWLSQPGVAQAIGWEEMKQGILVDLAQIAMRCPVPTPADDPRLPNLVAAGNIITGLRAQFPREAFLWFTGSLVGRRLGQLDLALAMAEQAYHLEPAWKNAIGVANVLRDQQQVAQAAAWFEKALGHDPNDVSALLDLGDMHLDAEAYPQAVAAYDRALAREPEHPWATPSRMYAAFRAAGDKTLPLALRRLADGGSDRALDLIDRVEPPSPFVTFLPRPGDASCAALDSVFQQMYQNPAAHHGSTVRLRLSHVESPSVIAAFWLQLEMWGAQVGLDLAFEQVPTPDPRVPKAQVPFVLWQWEGPMPRPTVARPDHALLVKLHHLAMEPFSFEVWVPRAQALARELGPGAIGALLGALVYPPRPQGGQRRVLPWVQRTQIATALVLAHIDDGWQGSHRQQVLYALLYGPSDWTTTAAIIALGVLARGDAAIRRDVEAAFSWMRTQVPADGFCPWAFPLACTHVALGNHPPAVESDLVAWRQRLQQEVGKSSVIASELEAKKFDLAAETQAAQAAAAQQRAGAAGDPDPVVFPGQPVARLSDYVRLMKQMQTGNMMGALAEFRLDMMAYAGVATAWGQALAADPTLNAKFAAMMQR